MLDKKYIDEYGQIAQSQSNYDGGDSFSFAGQWMVAVYFQYKAKIISKEDYKQQVRIYRSRIRAVEKSFGYFARHPNEDLWSGRSLVMSRDQMTANIVAMGVTRTYGPLFRMFLRHLILRGILFAENLRNNGMYPTKEEQQKKNPHKKWDGFKLKLPDLTGPDIWAAYVRAFRPFIFLYHIISGILVFKSIAPFYFLFLPTIVLLLGDLQLLIGAILEYKNIKNSHNETNFIIKLLQSTLDPTPFSIIARGIYKEKPLSPPVKGITPLKPFPPQSSLDYFFAGRNDFEPPIHNVYRPILRRFL